MFTAKLIMKTVDAFGESVIEKEMEVKTWSKEQRWREIREIMKQEITRYVINYEYLYFFSLPLKPKLKTKEDWSSGLREYKYTGKVSKRETKKLQDLYDELTKTSDIILYARLESFEHYFLEEYVMFLKMKYNY